jgi:hypothetical protein
VKIFISYSRRDADFAQQIDEYFQGSGYDIFTDVNDIEIGDAWSNIIEKNISTCDLFVVIVTNAALRSEEIEKEVLQAQKENKKIIPCIHKDVKYDEIKWNLKSIQGINFQDKYELSRNLYSKIVGKRSPPPPPRSSGATRDDDAIKHQGLNLKIIIPIVAVIGIVGIILAFTIFSGGIGGWNNNNKNVVSPQSSPLPSSSSQLQQCGTHPPGVMLFGSWRWSGPIYGTQASGIFTFQHDCTYTVDPTAGLSTNDEGTFVVTGSSDASITLTNKVSGEKHTYSVTKISENSFHMSNAENTVNLDFFRAS